MPYSRSTKNRLTRRDLARFPGDTLFERLARAVCEAGVLPRKELYEAWEVARRTRRRFRGGRVVDAAGGHGLLASVMLLLDDTSPEAIVVDPAPPPSAKALHDVLAVVWPRLAGRVRAASAPIEAWPLVHEDVVVSSHACGALTDRVLAAAIEARARVAVLPCCHEPATGGGEALGGWVDAALAIDLRRAMRLEHCGYRVWTQAIPADITPKNRLLLGAPAGLVRVAPMCSPDSRSVL